MAHDSVQQVKDTVRSVTENQINSDNNFTDLTALNKEKEAENQEAPACETTSKETEETVKQEPAPSQETAEPAPENAVPEEEKVEEFFDDDL